MGWKRQEVGGEFGWNRAPVVPSCPVHVPPDWRAAPGYGGHQQERRAGDEGVQIQGIDQRSLEDGWGVSVSVYVCFCDSTHCHPLPLPCSHTHRDSVTRRPFGLWYIYMLGAASAQRGRPMRCTWANINILHKEPLMCRGQSLGSAPLSRLSLERRVCRVNRGVGRYWRADGSDSQPNMKATQHILRSGKCIQIMSVTYL